MPFNIIDLGQSDYLKSLEFQENILKKVFEGKQNDSIIFVEYEPIYTVGKNANQDNIVTVPDKNIKIFDIDRGGDVTYHGPGQLVGYPIIRLNKYQIGIKHYVNLVEQILIEVLAHFGISAHTKPKYIGVWVESEKIAAIGIRVQKGITKHGFALNVNTELSYFENIIPCGIENCKMTSMETLLNKKNDLKLVQNIIVKSFNNHFHEL